MATTPRESWLFLAVGGIPNGVILDCVLDTRHRANTNPRTQLNSLLTVAGFELENLMSDRTTVIDGIAVPLFLCGTAWKEDETQRLAELAMQQGFRGIDTANQRRHYHEAAVGQAISASITSGVVNRDDLFLQTKFTFRRGQDYRLPYDPQASIPIQVEQSFASSLKHLGTARIDSYLLHGPTSSVGLSHTLPFPSSFQNSIGRTTFELGALLRYEQKPNSGKSTE